MNYLVCGYLGYDNLGDELMATAVSSSVFSCDKNAKIVFFAPRGKKYEEFDCVDRHSPVKILKSIKKCDVFILGGGTLISEEASKRSAYYYAAILWLAHIMKKRCIVWSGGIDRIRSRLLKKLLKKPLKNAQISLRDTASLDSLWEFCPCAEAKVHADAVFLLAGGRTPSSALRKHLAVCVKNGCPADLGVMVGDFCQKHSLIPVFIATSPRDMAECERQSALSGGVSILLRDLEDSRAVFETSAICLSMRYHAILLSACFGCVPISMSGSPKVMALMREMSLGELILPLAYSYQKYENTLKKALLSIEKYRQTCQTEVKKMLRRANLAEAFFMDG